jgi:peptidoglycan/LPS O-acetylase OafA/YrhL
MHSFAAAERRNNNLALVRLLAAMSVLFAHSWPAALGDGALDPISTALSAAFGRPVSLSGLAVNAFFVISGYLVTKSATRRSLGEFIFARIFRIYPALIMHVAVLVFALGPAMSSLSLEDYFRDHRSWGFLADNIFMWNAAYDLPGVFETAPVNAVNASLWTLPIEIRCYATLAVLTAIGLVRNRVLFVALLVTLSALQLLAPQLSLLGAESAAVNILFFIEGALTFLLARWLPASLAAIAAVLAFGLVLFKLGGAGVIAATGFGLAILWLGIIAPPVIDVMKSVGDASYGVYLWAFPVQQTIVAAGADGSPLLVAAIAAPAALLLGAGSWRFIERPALTLVQIAAKKTDELVRVVGRQRA